MKTLLKEDVPKYLKTWFVIHFIADISFAIPMFLFPLKFFKLLSWSVVDPIATRMVAAALFGIGIESLLSRNSSIDSFKTMLSLKIIWSSFALVGLILAVLNQLFPSLVVAFSLIGIFLFFNILWIYWYIKINIKK